VHLVTKPASTSRGSHKAVTSNPTELPIHEHTVLVIVFELAAAATPASAVDNGFSVGAGLDGSSLDFRGVDGAEELVAL
jgi:hypothetical protein